MNRKIVMIFGTFDIFHKGHIDFLKQARAYGDYLIVVVAKDKTVKQVKGDYPLNNENSRLTAINESRLADKVTLGNLKDKYAVIKEYKPDVIALGYDQRFFIDKLKAKLIEFNLDKTRIIKTKAYYPEIYKSSKLKDKMSIKNNLNFSQISREIIKYKNKEKSILLSGFFKTGKGQYGEGDKFLGLTVPIQRKIAKQFENLEFEEIEKLLASEHHEFRLVGLLILTYKYEWANESLRKKIFKFYLDNLKSVNNWDLVDLSAHKILGRYLWEIGGDRKFLYDLVKSDVLWDRRVAVLTTFYFLKNDDFTDTLKMAKMLLGDKEDLIQKAVGWMLREIGKRDEKVLIKFLDLHAMVMPRTMLRYSIERLSLQKRNYYMKKR